VNYVIDPTMFIAPFTLGYALFIVFLYVAVRTRKKILEEGRHLRGIPTLMGLLAFFDMMFLIMSGIFLFLDFLYLGFFILPVLILGPLIIAFIANSKIKKKERIEYEVVHMKMSGIEAVGIIGPILVILGCLMLTGSIFSKIFYIGILLQLFSQFYSLQYLL
jgi:hypothetical protein